MLKDLFGGKEPASRKAERMWLNNQIRRKFKEGKLPEILLVDPDQIDYTNRKILINNDAPPKPASVIETDNPKVERFERKFLKDIRAAMNEHKQINMTIYRAAIRQQKKRLLLEIIRRREANIAQREGER
jgi:hypothetical protein